MESKLSASYLKIFGSFSVVRKVSHLREFFTTIKSAEWQLFPTAPGPRPALCERQHYQMSLLRIETNLSKHIETSTESYPAKNYRGRVKISLGLQLNGGHSLWFLPLRSQTAVRRSAKRECF